MATVLTQAVKVSMILNGRSYYKFLGVYSGRLGKGEMEAQLGVVWKASLLDEIIDGNVKGTGSW